MRRCERKVMVRAHVRLRRLAHPQTACVVDDQLAGRRCERFDVAHRRQQSCASCGDDSGDARRCSAHDRHSARLRFQERDTECFIDRRPQQKIAVRQVIWDVLRRSRADEGDAIAQFTESLFHFTARGTITDDTQRPPQVAKPRER